MLTYSELMMRHIKGLSELDVLCFSVPWSYESFLAELDNKKARYVICEDDEKVVGYIGYWKVLDEGQITNVAVLPEYRGQKIAKKMLNMAIAQAEKDELLTLSLEVRESNLAAISLYEGFGFERVGYRKNYYKNPTEAAILMELIIEREN